VCVCITFLTVIGIPAAVVVVVVEHGLLALGVVLHDTRADVAAFLGLLVSSNVIVELCIQDERPVDGVQVAEFGVLLDADGSAGDVPQVVQADVLQAGHLEDHQRIVVEEVPPTYDGEVWEERAQAVQAGHSEQQQVVGDHGQLGEAERAEDILMDVVVVLVANEEDLQVALHHRAVLQAPELADVVPDVDAGTADCGEGRNKKTLSKTVSSF